MLLEFIFERPHANVSNTERALQIGLCNPSLGPSAETWGLGPAEYEKQGNIHCLKGEDLLVGALQVPVTPETLSQRSQQAYREVLALSGNHNLFRCWNFVPDINHCPEGGFENYQSFCEGRSLAFQEIDAGQAFNRMPAASAVGTMGDHLSVIFICGPHGSKNLENPQQTPAYNYPRRYGPQPPSFARATTIDEQSQTRIYISGTASIIQSESVGQTIEEQLAVTLENLGLIEKSALDASAPPPGAGRKVRVYLRHAQDYEYVREKLHQCFIREDDAVIYVVADICRKELLVEIEVSLGF